MTTESAAETPQKLEREPALQLLKEMLRIRRFEERCAELYSAGKIRGFLHLYIGEEAVGRRAADGRRPRARRPDAGPTARHRLLLW